MPIISDQKTHSIKLSKIDTTPPAEFSKGDCKKQLKVFRKKLFDLQNIFFADGRSSLLIIFQGLDAAGKDGSIRHVMSSMNPMGINVKPFKEPTAEETNHDFLWRVYPHFPARGMIEVFNRSYYEDLIVPAISKSLTKGEINERYKLINTLEDHLVRSKIHVLKFFLHVSGEEQENRINQRLEQPDKRWKYSASDQVVASRYNDYIKVYDEVLNSCNSKKWHIIAADKRWYRNYAVARVITDYLESINLKFPE